MSNEVDNQVENFETDDQTNQSQANENTNPNSWVVGIDPLEVYRLTLDAILAAQEQLLGTGSIETGHIETGHIETGSIETGSLEAGLTATCRIPATCPTGFQGRYTVRSGDSMFSIAQRCGVTLQALINANRHIPNPNQIFPCDVLCVPPRCADATPTCRIPATCPTGFQGRYTVRPGDSMFTIAQRCGVTLQALINANRHIPNPNQIFPCDVLCVPPRCADTCRVPSSCPPGFLGRYTVRSGDSMFTIAQRCGVSLQSLIRANPHITNPNQIFPCDVLCVPLSCALRFNIEEELQSEE